MPECVVAKLRRFQKKNNSLVAGIFALEQLHFGAVFFETGPEQFFLCKSH
jgi:hypothetical protein